jgi:hypothetical protein
MSKLNTAVAVALRDVETLRTWKASHKTEHREDEKSKISRGQAFVMLFLSTCLGLICGIVATIISRGIFK